MGYCGQAHNIVQCEWHSIKTGQKARLVTWLSQFVRERERQTTLLWQRLKSIQILHPQLYANVSFAVCYIILGWWNFSVAKDVLGNSMAYWESEGDSNGWKQAVAHLVGTKRRCNLLVWVAKGRNNWKNWCLVNETRKTRFHVSAWFHQWFHWKYINSIRSSTFWLSLGRVKWPETCWSMPRFGQGGMIVAWYIL